MSRPQSILVTLTLIGWSPEYFLMYFFNKFKPRLRHMLRTAYYKVFIFFSKVDMENVKTPVDFGDPYFN